MRQHHCGGSPRLLCGSIPAGRLLTLGFAFLVAMPAANPSVALAQAASPPSGVATQPDPDRAKLEKQKLEHEIARLDKELSSLTWALQWANALTPLTVVVVGGMVGFFFNRRLNDLQEAEESRRQAQSLAEQRRQTAEERAANQFSALTEDRARSYARAYEHLSPTALYFAHFDADPPASDPTLDGPALAQTRASSSGSATFEPAPSRSRESLQLDKDDCARMGRRLSSWYFGTGGLLMTKTSRDAYFNLMEALRRAVTDPAELAVQTVEQHNKLISMPMITDYRLRLAKKRYSVFDQLERNQPIMPADIGQWKFGRTAADDDAEQFKDFVLIQTLASRFRTALTDDIGSRTPPAPTDAERYRVKTREG